MANTLEVDNRRDAGAPVLPAAYDETNAPACHGANPRIFFPAHEVPLGEREIREAKNICSRCPVREDCLALAIQSGETDGVWGGTTPAERRSIRLQLRRFNGTKNLVEALARGHEEHVRPVDRPAVVVQLLQLGWDVRQVAKALSITPFDVAGARAQGAQILVYRRLLQRRYPEGWE
ncbi:WhiB family transcriptional regulator [Streptomyces sp. NPDC020681]|uniref:WhiB family transcriptional regulator n=1 Tax=Streptomyces sp. NPDC020681 TaxID=3365083 RepID=UPI00379FCA40